MEDKPIPETLFYIKKIIFESTENTMLDLIHITEEKYEYLSEKQCIIHPEILRSTIREVTVDDISDKYKTDYQNNNYVEVKKYITKEEVDSIVSLAEETNDTIYEIVEKYI